MIVLLICLGAYLLGAIPFGLLLTRLAGLGDIRAIGSGNIGATNVLRTGKKGLAAATLLLDGLKGTLAVLCAREFGMHAALLAALAVFLGHLYPVWLGFKGGKGVATGLGVFFGLCWPLGLVCCVTWLLAAFALRWSSVAALCAYAVAPLTFFVFQSRQSALLALLIAALVFWRHRANITRLLAGTEPRIGQKA